MSAASPQLIKEMQPSEYRQFGLMFGAIIIVLFGLFFPWLFSANFPVWPWAVGGIFVLWALVLPYSLRLVYGPWMRFAMVLGFINTRLLLGLTFFLLFVPVAIFFRISGKDPLNRKVYGGKMESYWIESSSREKENMEHIY